MIHIEPALLHMIADAANLDHHVVMDQLQALVDECRQYPCNFTHQMVRNFKNRIPAWEKKSIDNRVWILRGYYPQTSVFFKMTTVMHPNDKNALTKVMFPKSSRLKQMATYSKKEKDKVAEAIILNNTPKPLVRRPKCMSPKGMRILRQVK